MSTHISKANNLRRIEDTITHNIDLAKRYVSKGQTAHAMLILECLEDYWICYQDLVKPLLVPPSKRKK